MAFHFVCFLALQCTHKHTRGNIQWYSQIFCLSLRGISEWKDSKPYQNKNHQKSKKHSSNVITVWTKMQLGSWLLEREVQKEVEGKQPLSRHDSDPEKAVSSQILHINTTATAAGLSLVLSPKSTPWSVFFHYPKEQFFQNDPQSKRLFTSLVILPKHSAIKYFGIINMAVLPSNLIQRSLKIAKHS